MIPMIQMIITQDMWGVMERDTPIILSGMRVIAMMKTGTMIDNKIVFKFHFLFLNLRGKRWVTLLGRAFNLRSK